MQIAIITGEASGDRAGAQLAREIKRLCPEAQIWGTGGQAMREAGVEIVKDASRWGVVGIASGLAILPKVLAASRMLYGELSRRKPDVVVPVDAGAFNIGFAGIKGLCPYVRANLPQTKILYYFPPGSWRRELKASPLAHLADVVATPFPWSETELRKFGVNAYFVGHPLLDSVRPSQSPEAFAQKWGLDKERPLVGILPGSRAGEIAHVLPVQLAAASIIHRRVPSAQFLVGVAPTVDRQTIVRAVEREQAKTGEAHQAVLPQGSGTLGTIAVPVEGGTGARAEDLAKRQQEWIRRAAELPNPSGPFPIAVVENATYDVIAASDVLLITSGTATLEAAILGKPMVIAYKMASVNQIEYHFVRQRLPRFIGMPNLLANKRICPEFIQEAVTPDALANEIIGLLLEPERMLQMRTDLREAVSLLGQPGGAARTAEMVIALANGETLARQTSTHGEHTPPANSSEG